MNTTIASSDTLAPSQTSRRAKGIRFWTRRVVLGLGVALAALSAVGASYQAIATANDRQKLVPPGQFIDVGGYRLHLSTMGADRQGPTVILESGLAFPAVEWALVQPEVAAFARVVAYDRPGLGWSEDGDQPHDALHIAQQLHRALQQARITGPYVFVGHSAGGLYARAFATEYPNEVAGMVFVDATTPGQFAQIPTLVRGQQTVGAMLQIASVLAWVGVPRLADLPAFFMGYEEPRVVAEFPQMAAMRALWASPHHLAAAADEAALVADTSSAQVGGAGSLRAMPVVVLTAGEGAVEGWAQAQAELTALSSNSDQRIIPGISHGAFTLDRQHIAVTVAAIREVVEAARTGQLLAKEHRHTSKG